MAEAYAQVEHGLGRSAVVYEIHVLMALVVDIVLKIRPIFHRERIISLSTTQEAGRAHQGPSLANLSLSEPGDARGISFPRLDSLERSVV